MSTNRGTTLLENIHIPREKIVQFCRQNHIQKLGFFGSVLRDDFNSESDLDILVEFSPNHIPGWEFVTMQDELSQIFGRKVDLNTAGFLSETFRDKVLQETVVVYG